MEKLATKKELIDRIRLAEGPDFECNEEAILDTYQKQEGNTSSLPIKILSIFGGVLATLAFLAFLAITGLYDSEVGLIIFGLGFIFSAIWLNKAFEKLIIDTFSISIYIAGYALFTLGFIMLNEGETLNLTAILICLIAVSSLLISQNYILSFISILIINGSFLFLIFNNEIYDLIHLYLAIVVSITAYVFLQEAKIISSGKKGSKLYDPIRIGLIISFLFGLIVVGKRNLVPISQAYIWLSSIVLGIVVIYLVSRILQINEVESNRDKGLIYVLSFLILLSTAFAPAISGAIVIVLLSFLVNYKTGLVIGIISLFYFVSQYYYDLSFTLLTKSIILFSSGVLFLLFFLFTSKALQTHAEN